MNVYRSIIFIILSFFLVSSCIQEPVTLTKKEIITIIEKSASLKISDDFIATPNTIIHTVGAFDSDYTIELTLQFDKKTSIEISSEIRALKNFWL